MTKFQVVDNHQIPENGVQRLDLQEVAGSWVCLYEWDRLVHGWIPRLMDHQEAVFSLALLNRAAL